MSLLREDPRCRNCGHPTSYHSTPVCGYDHGAGRKPCQCAQWDGVSYSLEAAEVRIAELVMERDAYMQALLDVIHGFVARPVAEVEREAPQDQADGPLCFALRWLEVSNPGHDHEMCTLTLEHDGDHANRLHTWPR